MENQTECAVLLRRHPFQIEVCERNVLSKLRVFSHIPKSEPLVLIDLTTKSVKKVIIEPPAAVDLVLCSTRSSACGRPVVVYGWPVVVYGWPKFPKRVVSRWPGVIYGWPWSRVLPSSHPRMAGEPDRKQATFLLVAR